MATAKHTPGKSAAKKSAPPPKAPAKKAAPKADHVIRAPAKATVHKAAQVMADSKKATPQVKAAGVVLSAASHKGQHTTGKEVKAIRAAEKALTPAKKIATKTSAPTAKKLATVPAAAKKAAASPAKPRQEVTKLVIRETPAAKAERERRGRVVTSSIMAVPDSRTPAKKTAPAKADHVSRPHAPPAPVKRDPNKIVEDLKAQVRQVQSPPPTAAPQAAAAPVQPWSAEAVRSEPVDQSLAAARPHSTPNVSSQRATEAAAGTKGAPVTLSAATRTPAPEPSPVQRVVASRPAETPQRVAKDLPHGIDALAASAGTGTAVPASAPVTVPAVRPAPRSEWQGGTPFGGSGNGSGWPRSQLAGGSSSVTAQQNASHQAQPGLIERRFEVFNAGMGSHKWRLVEAGTGQLISVGRETFGTPGDAEANAAQEAKLYKPGTCVIVRL